MDPQSPSTPVTDPPVLTTPVLQPRGNGSKNSKKLFIIVGIVAVVGLLLFMTIVLQKRSKNKHAAATSTGSAASQQGNALPSSNASNSSTVATAKNPLPFVYGAWFSNESRIYVSDPETNATTVLATLPFTIKKIVPLSETSLLYINNTNVHDEGTDISRFNVSSHLTTQVVLADAGYLIDDYDVSPNGKYLVDWELQLNSQDSKVKGGKSRVYTVDLSNPAKKVLLYDEIAADVPIHYPLAITDTKEVYLDTYLPNSGPGYAYGMTVSTFDGTQKHDLPDMQNGTYTSQPQLSPDGNDLLFTGYDGSKGKGADVVNGIRTALNNPTSVDIYDIKAQKRRTLANLPKGKLFYNMLTSMSDPDVIFFRVADVSNLLENSVYRYRIKDQSIQRIVLPSTATNNSIVIAALSPTILLIGDKTADKTITGNLGMRYASPYTTLSGWNTETNAILPLPLGDVSLAQFVGTVPPESSKVLGVAITPSPTPGYNLQMNSFPFATLTPVPPPTAIPQPPVTKPDLETQRTDDQTAPTHEQEVHDPKDILTPANSDGCYCSSPLYLYGPEGQKMMVTIHTGIFDDIPLSRNGVYQVQLAGAGKLRIHTQLYDSIAYDYVPHIHPRIPVYGSIATQEDLPQIILAYAKYLDLQQNELSDLLGYAKKNLSAPFTFVSFFDETTSEKILPLSFSPQPNHYQNIVFYFRDLQTQPENLPEVPVFPKLQERTGVTAIEISEYHE